MHAVLRFDCRTCALCILLWLTSLVVATSALMLSCGRRLLELAGLDASFAGKDPGALSVGEQQRVSIARALALEPEALLMDEPTSALDEAARRRIEELVRELNDSLGLTIVVVSHDLDQVSRVADRVVVLVDGRSEGEWGTDEFFSGPGEKARRYISGRS